MTSGGAVLTSRWMNVRHSDHLSILAGMKISRLVCFPDTFEINRERAIDYLNTRDNVYVFDGFAGVGRYSTHVVYVSLTYKPVGPEIPD
jgi:hypothetical protein